MPDPLRNQRSSATSWHQIADYSVIEARQLGQSGPDLWHAPKPGPLYWDWRCLRCSEPVADHPSWWARLRRRWRS